VEAEGFHLRATAADVAPQSRVMADVVEERRYHLEVEALVVHLETVWEGLSSDLEEVEEWWQGQYCDQP
jgi:hypothetical protein